MHLLLKIHYAYQLWVNIHGTYVGVSNIHYISILSIAFLGCYEDCGKVHGVYNVKRTGSCFVRRGRSYSQCLIDGVNRETASMHHSVTHVYTPTVQHIFVPPYACTRTAGSRKGNEKIIQLTGKRHYPNQRTAVGEFVPIS